ncbi:MAG TPA: hypothetical protein VMH02_05065 [Verrucomicrobiae bacterium]|nr:hypothetical protein [Verrucomicrobiae bacterium]
MIYRHEQVGRLLIAYLAAIAAAALAVLGFYAAAPSTPLLSKIVLAIVFVVPLLAIAAFARLTVCVEGSGVRWGLTFGFPGGFVPFDQVESVEIVPVSFWYGIGIHLTVRGWVWNVALGRGVQIHRRAGLPIVLGTDDPEGLLQAIERARAA